LFGETLVSKFGEGTQQVAEASPFALCELSASVKRFKRPRLASQDVPRSRHPVGPLSMD
jgi:hypothetical protein